MVRIGSRSIACVVGFGLSVFGFALVGCSGGDTSTGEQDISQIMDPVERGRLYVAKRDCPSCHQSADAKAGTLSGQTEPVAGTMAFGQNLTPDMDTGMGGWSDGQLTKAIRTGIDDDDAQLCQVMKPFTTMSDAEVADIIKYLRSLPAVSHAIPESHCPPLKP
jgi:hypothetical protein